MALEAGEEKLSQEDAPSHEVVQWDTAAAEGSIFPYNLM